MSVVYRQDVIDVIKDMKDIVHMTALRVDAEIAMQLSQAVEDTAMAVYRAGYAEGKHDARN